MGGSGSTRWNGHRRHRTERDAYAFCTAALKPALRSWLETSGTFECRANGRTFFSGHLVVGRVMRDDYGSLTRTLTIAYDERPKWPDRITLTPVPGRFGGLVWFLHCPTCDRRVRTLYALPPKFLQQAWCRACCGLRYQVQRLSPERRAGAMVQRVARRINPADRTLAEDLAAPPPKPKRMRWATYERLCDRFYDAVEARDDVYNVRLAAWVWRTMPDAWRQEFMQARAS